MSLSIIPRATFAVTTTLTVLGTYFTPTSEVRLYLCNIHLHYLVDVEISNSQQPLSRSTQALINTYETYIFEAGQVIGDGVHANVALPLHNVTLCLKKPADVVVADVLDFGQR